MAATATRASGSAGSRAYRVRVIGLGRRLAAAIIDGLVIALATFALIIVVGFMGILSASFNWQDPNTFSGLLVLGGILISVIYYAGFWRGAGQTFGMQTLGIRVIGKDGRSLGWGKALLRYVGFLISGIVWSLGFLWIAFDGKRQGWHDKLAGTLVVDADEEFAADEQLEYVPSDAGRGWIWAALWVVLLLAAPAALFGSLIFLGPIVRQFIPGFQ